MLEDEDVRSPAPPTYGAHSLTRSVRCSQLSPQEWDRCDALWAAVAGGADVETCPIATLIAMHESDKASCWAETLRYFGGFRASVL